MRRTLQITGLLVIIVASFGYAGIRYQANRQDERTWFNQHWRSSFARHASLRWLFGLHRDGDNQRAYLAVQEPSTLTLVLVNDDRVVVPEDAVERAAAVIGETLGIPGRVAIVPGAVLAPTTSYSATQLRRLPRPTPAGAQDPVLYLYALTSFTDAPSYVGSTVREDGIALFFTELDSLVHRSPATRTSLVVSTILHEFGHQIGVPHIDDSTCIMAPSVEQPGSALSALALVPTTYCPQERAAIAALQQAR